MNAPEILVEEVSPNGNVFATYRDRKPHPSADRYTFCFANPGRCFYRKCCHSGGVPDQPANIYPAVSLQFREQPGSMQPASDILAGPYRKFHNSEPDQAQRDDRFRFVRSDGDGSMR